MTCGMNGGKEAPQDPVKAPSTKTLSAAAAGVGVIATRETKIRESNTCFVAGSADRVAT